MGNSTLTIAEARYLHEVPLAHIVQQRESGATTTTNESGNKTTTAAARNTTDTDVRAARDSQPTSTAGQCSSNRLCVPGLQHKTNAYKPIDGKNNSNMQIRDLETSKSHDRDFM
mmetsp:Transcript_44947/g.82194  ORF Transcript_44947/g.82194 Transcript_44947/m.82194 type:complete len:114 (+) Transcript_44947:68-409(+)